jgi:serine/threonine-protein kinase
MSPEQVNETKSVTAQSDIYSLGVVLWQMVMGQKPYDTKTISNFELQLKIVQEPLTLTHTIWDNCIQKATHKNIDSRYTSVQLFLNDLKNLGYINDDKTILKKNDEKTIFENKEEATIIENNKTQTNTPTEEKAQSTGNTTAANVEKEKKKPIGLIIGVIAGVVLLLVIIILIAKNGPSKEEIAAKQYAMEDSIAAAAQMEADSIAMAADSLADEAAYEAAGYGGAVTDANATYNGHFVFWFDADYNGKWVGNVNIYIDDEYVGTVNNWFNENPGCWTDGCVTISRPPGAYRFTANSDDGTSWNTEYITITENDCNNLRLTVN